MSEDEIELFEEELGASEQEEEQERVAVAEEEYDPEKPEDLKTTFEKAAEQEEELEREAEDLGAEDSTSETHDSDEEDDSIVNDEIEPICKNHSKCIEVAKQVDEFVCARMQVRTEKPGTRRAFLAEVICDHYRA